MLPKFAYVRAASKEQAIRHLADRNASAFAGGTDLLGCLREETFPVDKVVSLGQIEEFKGVRATRDGGLRIGALTTITEVAEHPEISSRYPGLSQAAAAVASPQLRNQGTLGGNLCQRPRCWYYRGQFHCLKKGGDECFAFAGENRYHAIFGGGPCYIVHPSDTAPALVALEAQLTIAGPEGERRVPAGDFFVLPRERIDREVILKADEIVTEVLLPRPAANLRSSYRKVRERLAWDFALTSVALALEFDGSSISKARVVLGGVAPIPWRAEAAEQVLKGKTITRDTARQASLAAAQGADPLEQNAYKVELVKGVVEESLLALA
ncbi:MAG TPA: xanthine dehydrogenase family protein subunit M [Acidobacteriota bacterium]|nr:xanthine dehydrogenase family protein subunit M [Acidobacteriota bacterium]